MQRFGRGLAIWTIGVVLGVVFGGVDPSAADSVVLTPSKDNTLFESESGLLSNGAGPSMFTGRTRSFGVRRAVVAFAVADSIPSAAQVDSVRLELTMQKTVSGASPVSLHRLLQDWGEGTSFTSAGGGDDASAGDATWIHTLFPDAFWDQPGGDFDAASSATTTVDQIGLYTWGSTEEMVADVQGWVSDPPTNFGWILIGDETDVSAKLFATREGAESAVPRLIVHFTRPTAVEAQTWSVVKKLYR